MRKEIVPSTVLGHQSNAVILSIGLRRDTVDNRASLRHVELPIEDPNQRIISIEEAEDALGISAFDESPDWLQRHHCH
jgi:hypothetical protein